MTLGIILVTRHQGPLPFKRRTFRDPSSGIDPGTAGIWTLARANGRDVYPVLGDFLAASYANMRKTWAMHEKAPGCGHAASRPRRSSREHWIYPVSKALQHPWTPESTCK